jgi:hypothetical protein
MRQGLACRISQLGIQLRPQGLRREAGAFGQRAQFGPGEVGVDSAAEAAIGAGNDVLAADDRDVAQDAVGDELRLARRQFGVLPHPPLMLVAHIGSLEGIGLRLDLEDEINDPKSGSWVIAYWGRIGGTVGDGHISSSAFGSPCG